ncbi:replication endonuclease [Vibrio parahaemolyticus]
MSNNKSPIEHHLDIERIKRLDSIEKEKWINRIKKEISPEYCIHFSYTQLKSVGKKVLTLINTLSFEIQDKISNTKSSDDLELLYDEFITTLEVHINERFMKSMPKLVRKKGGLVKNHYVNYLKYLDLKTVKNRYYSFLSKELYHLDQKYRQVGDDKTKSDNHIRKYASERAMKVREEQLSSHNNYLENLILENGKTVKDIQKTMSSKLFELYVTIKGYEDISKEKDFIWLFITLTCPPEFHPNPSEKFGFSKWDGSYVNDAKDFFTNKFRLIRMKANDDEMNFSLNSAFGIKVLEPHKDGTPHVHLILFVKREYEDYYKNLFIRYFRRYVEVPFHDQDGNLIEYHGCDIIREGYDRNGVKLEDENISSAASYVIKYCLKNQELNSLNTSKFGDNDIDAINAWKSANRLRSFSMLGVKGISTKYNDCRKLANFLRKQNNYEKSFKDIVLKDAYDYMKAVLRTEINYNYSREDMLADVNQLIFDLDKFLDLVKLSSEKNKKYQVKDKSGNIKTKYGIDMKNFIINSNQLEYDHEKYRGRFNEVKKKKTALKVGLAKFSFDKIKTLEVIYNKNKPTPSDEQ